MAETHHMRADMHAEIIWLPLRLTHQARLPDPQGGEATAGSRSAEAARRREAQQRRRDRPATHANHLVFLSARPESYRGWSEELSLRSIFDPLVRHDKLYRLCSCPERF